MVVLCDSCRAARKEFLHQKVRELFPLRDRMRDALAVESYYKTRNQITADAINDMMASPSNPWRFALSTEDIQFLIILFLKHELVFTDWHFGPLTDDFNGDLPKDLIRLNELGFITDNGQPGGVENIVSVFDNKPYIERQRQYLNAFVLREKWDRIVTDPEFEYTLRDSDVFCRSYIANADASPAGLTWNNFPREFGGDDLTDILDPETKERIEVQTHMPAELEDDILYHVSSQEAKEDLASRTYHVDLYTTRWGVPNHVVATLLPFFEKYK